MGWFRCGIYGVVFDQKVRKSGAISCVCADFEPKELVGT